MKKNIFLLIALTVLLGCDTESYNERHRFSNYYAIVDENDLETIQWLIPTDTDKVYTESEEINTEAFKTIPNDLIWFNDNTLYVNMPADYLYYDGDKTANQDWKKDGGTSYLKMLNPVPGKHLLSISIENY